MAEISTSSRNSKTNLVLEGIRTKKVLLIGLLFSILSFSHLPVAVFPHIFDKNGAAQFITLTVIAALFGGYIVWRSSQFVTHAYLRAAILFLILAVLASAMLSGNIITAFTGDTGRYAGAITLFCLIIVAIFHSPLTFEQLKRLIEIYVFTTFLISLVGIAQNFNLIELPGDQGVTSVLGNSNFFAAYLGTSMPLYFFLSIGASRRRKAILATAVLIVFASLVWADPLQSYVDIAFTLIGISIFLLRKRIPRFNWTLNARTFLGTFALIIWAEFIFLVPFLGSWIPVLGNDIQVKIRSNFWLAAVKQFFEFPLLGVGPDQYGSYYEKFRTFEDARAYEKILSNDAHSASVQTLATLGGIGTLAILILVAILVRSLMIQWDTKPEQRPWLFALGLFFFVYYTNSFVSPMTIPSKYLFWALAGWVIGKTYLGDISKKVNLRVPVASLVVLILFVGANFATAQWRYANAFEKFAKDREAVGSYEFNPFLPCFMYFEGAFNMNAKRPIEDIAQLARQQIGANPRCVSAHLILAQIYQGTADMDRWRTQILAMVEIAPTRVEVLRMGLEYATKAGDVDLYNELQERMSKLGLVYVPGNPG